MIENFWKDKYPAGITAEINPDEFPNIQAVLKQSCQRFADKPAFSNLGKTITCLLYTSPSPRDRQKSRMPSSA